MNAPEFKTWWEGFARVFPETSAWVNGLGPSGKATLLDAWADVLADTDLGDAQEVTRRMLAGDDEPLAAFDREKTPGHVRRLAIALRNSRGENSGKEPLRVERTGKPAPLSALLADMLLAKEQGATPEQIKACMTEYAAKHHTPADERDSPRYYCATCRDSGMVTCWSDAAIMAVRDGGTEAVVKCKYPTWGMLCSCRRGERKPEGAMKNFGRYDPAVAYLCPRGEASEENILAFEFDYESRREKYWASRRHSEFDAYNREPSQQQAF